MVLLTEIYIPALLFKNDIKIITRIFPVVLYQFYTILRINITHITN